MSTIELIELAELIFDKERTAKTKFSIERIRKEHKLSKYEAQKVWTVLEVFRAQGNDTSSVKRIIHALEEEIKHLKKQHNKKSKECGKFEHILNKIEDRISELDIPDITIQTPTKNGKVDQQDVVLLLSDFHIGEKVEVPNPFGDGYANIYNLEIAKKRISSILTKLERYVQIHREFSEILQGHIILLGDLVSGQNLHDDLDMTNEFHIADQTLHTASIITNIVLRLAKIFPKLKVYGVPGNHGRTNKKKLHKLPTSSFDYLAYRIAETEISAIQDKIEADIEFHISKGSFLVREIQGHNILMTHGDNIKSWAGIPYYGMMRDYSAKQELSLALSKQPIHYIVMGHFHQPITINKAVGGIIVNGSLKGFDEYSIDMNYVNPPSQTMFGISKKYGKTFLYELVPDE